MSTNVSDTTKSSRREQRSSAQTFIDNLKGMAHPNSRRIFIQGSRPDIRVPLREIQLADTFVADNPRFRFHPYPGRASGYVVDTMQTVLHFTFSEPDFERALIGAVNRGDDADTTAALIGMLHGAQCGATALPRQWLDRLDSAIAAAIVAQTGALLTLAARTRHELPRRLA